MRRLHLEPAPPQLWGLGAAGVKGPHCAQRQAVQRAKIKGMRIIQLSLTGLRGGFYKAIYVKALRNFVRGPVNVR